MKLPRLFSSRSPAPVEQKGSRALKVHLTGPAQPVWSDRTYRGYSSEGYTQNVIAHQAINKIANAVATITWKAEKDGELLDEHPVLDLINKPNPVQSGADWWRQRIAYLLLSGNLYDERFIVNNQLRELWVPRPDRMTIVPGDSGIPSSFIYSTDGQKKIYYPVDSRTADSDINHTRLFHPLNDWYGLSPLAAGAYAIDQHNESMKWLQALLQNSARPSGALLLDDDQTLSDEQFNRLKTQIDEQYSGSSNAGRPMLLEGGLDWRPMGLSPEDMLITDTKDGSARDISLALGVPPLLLNIPGDNTYSNYREARLGFYEDTIVPLVTFMLSDLNQWMSPFFDAKIVPDLDSIEALAEKRRGMWEMVDNSDELTVNEARKLKGFPPLAEPLGSTLLAHLRAATRGHKEPNSTTPPNEEQE